MPRNGTGPGASRAAAGSSLAGEHPQHSKISPETLAAVERASAHDALEAASLDVLSGAQSISFGYDRQAPAAATSAPAAFDYSALDADVATLAGGAAKRIGDRTRASFIENGRDLIAIKALLGHGAFCTWLRAEFDMSERTAKNLMGAAELVDAKTANIAVLPVTEIYRLAAPSTPGTVRDEIIARVDSGECLTVQEISEAIADGRRQEVAARAKQKRRPQGVSEHKRRQLERESEKRRQAEAKAEEAADAAVDLLREHLGGDLHTFKELLTRAGVWRVQAKLGTARP